VARLLVNYDLTNDYLLSGSARTDGVVKVGKCPFSVIGKKVSYITYPELSDYYARLNYMLVYYNLLDDVHDDGSLIAKWMAHSMEKHLSRLDASMCREAELLQEYLGQLRGIEEENKLLPVMEVAHLFGRLLRDMVKPPFLFEGDEGSFSLINYWVGVWIYTMDAIVDALRDGYKKRYNPILSGLRGNPLTILRSRKQELLDILRKCTENISVLLDTYPTYENAALLRQLFSGQLPRIVCIYLEVEKDEFITQGKAAAARKLQ